MRAAQLYRHYRGRWNYLIGRRDFQTHPLRTLWRLCLWRLHCWLGWRAIVSLPLWQARFVFPPWWGARGTTSFFLSRESYEPELTCLARLLPVGGTFIDGGANLGIYTIAAASIVGSTGRVVAFEPQQTVFRALEANVALNAFSWVDLRAVALSDQEGEAQLFGGSEGVVNASFGNYSSCISQTVRTTTLDLAVAETGLLRLDVLKLDVEGAEELVLRGASKTLARYQPTVIFEVNPPALTALGLAMDGAWKILERHGYRFFQLAENGSLVPAIMPEEPANVVALPPKAADV